MIAYLLIALFAATSLIVVVSLVDSLVRGRNAYKAIRGEMRSNALTAATANEPQPALPALRITRRTNRLAAGRPMPRPQLAAAA